MDSRAHLLLQVEPGQAAPVAEAVAALPHVREAAQTSGAYDVIAVVDGHDLHRALAQVRQIAGLCALRICRSA
ncbi:MAG: Lrp/AsnC ligand binding domain-containing protein [Actinomycetes bacterium]